MEFSRGCASVDKVQAQEFTRMSEFDKYLLCRGSVLSLSTSSE